MLERGRTVTVFPNLLLNDVASTCIRVWRPLGIGLTEIETWCIAPKGEAPESRRARIRKYEDFFFPASLAVPDDVRAMEEAQTGSEAVNDEWNDLALGHKTLMDGADAAAQELGVVPLNSNPGREVETPFFAFWRMGDAVILMSIAVEQITTLLHQEAWFLDHKRWDDWLLSMIRMRFIGHMCWWAMRLDRRSR